MAQARILVITGLSGGGKSVALKTLEDEGFEAIDNLPLSFLPAVLAARDTAHPLAVGVDIRSRGFSGEALAATLMALKKEYAAVLSVLFFECDDETLQRRFTETRRRHPLAEDRPVADGITQERSLMAPVRKLADEIMDTTDSSLPVLRRNIVQRFAHGREDSMTITVMSFSYRQGVPREADMVFDVRFLRNPHYVEAMRDLTGQDAAVAAYIQEDAAYADFMVHIINLLLPLLPRYREEGKHYLTVAIGCTGGQHRSVHVAEALAERFKLAGEKVSLIHRELG